jgi:hypothetical protein
MFLVILFIVCFDYMFSIVKVSNIFMHRITECSTQCFNGLSSQTLCRRGVYTFFHVDAPCILEQVVDRTGDSHVDSLYSTSRL